MTGKIIITQCIAYIRIAKLPIGISVFTENIIHHQTANVHLLSGRLLRDVPSTSDRVMSINAFSLERERLVKPETAACFPSCLTVNRGGDAAGPSNRTQTTDFILPSPGFFFVVISTEVDIDIAAFFLSSIFTSTSVEAETRRHPGRPRRTADIHAPWMLRDPRQV